MLCRPEQDVELLVYKGLDVLATPYPLRATHSVIRMTFGHGAPACNATCSSYRTRTQRTTACSPCCSPSCPRSGNPNPGHEGEEDGLHVVLRVRVTRRAGRIAGRRAVPTLHADNRIRRSEGVIVPTSLAYLGTTSITANTVRLSLGLKICKLEDDMHHTSVRMAKEVVVKQYERERKHSSSNYLYLCRLVGVTCPVTCQMSAIIFLFYFPLLLWCLRFTKLWVGLG